MKKIVKMKTTKEAQKLSANLVLAEGCDFKTAVKLIKKTMMDLGYKNLDLLISNSVGFFKGKEAFCVKIESYYQSSAPDNKDAALWRKNFFNMISVVMMQLSEHTIIKDVNGKIDYLVKR